MKYVTTLEQSKKLQELGVVQEAKNFWCCIMPDPTGERYYYEVLDIITPPVTLTEQIASAYNSDELLNALPHEFSIQEGCNEFELCVCKTSKSFEVSYIDRVYDDAIVSYAIVQNEILPHALADMAIQLLTEHPEQVEIFNNNLKEYLNK